MDDHRYAILDVCNLAYRCYHAIPTYVWMKDPTALAVSMIQTCKKLEEELAVDTMVFTFDGGSDFRKRLYPEYKAGRKIREEQKTEDEKEAKQQFFQQLDAFRKNHLQMIGSKNVFHAVGYEADDLIASAVRELSKAKKVYIVSSDEDLFQLIEGNRVVLYLPNKKAVYNEDAYRQSHFNAPPCMQASIKAWAGCSSDGIEGLKNVGELKAAKFVMGTGPNREQFFANIEVYNRNIQLTRLPVPGTPKCVPVPQEEPLKWDGLLAAIQSATRPKGLR